MNLANQLEVYVGFSNFHGDPCSGCFHPLPQETYIAKIKSGGDFRMLKLCPDCLEFLILPSAPGVQ